jgi:hypothetical protein
MSRVVYSDIQATAAQELLRSSHGVRIVADAEEGTGLNALPAGVYGYTYSPGLPNAPLFAVRRFRSYETHKVEGEAFIIGFVTADTARALAIALTDMSIQVQPDPDQESDTLIAVPYSRIRQHRQYAAPNQHGFSVTVSPTRASSSSAPFETATR